jgi:hypothetical protein
VTRVVDVPRYYTVQAIDPTNWTEAEAHLKALFDPYDVVEEQRDSDTARWIIITNGKELKDGIETLDTVHLVNPTPQPKRHEPHDDDTYIASAKPSGDNEAIDASITSQVQSGNLVYRLAHKNRTTAWYNLHLTAEAKQAVENYEGGESIWVEDEARFLSAETHRSSPPVEASPEATLIKSDHRDGIQPCSCLLKDTSNIQEVEDYLQTRVQRGSKYYPYWRASKVIGWWNLALDSEAQKVVKEYEKMKFFKIGRTEGTRCSSSSESESSLPQRDNKHSVLPRVGDWIGPIAEDTESWSITSKVPNDVEANLRAKDGVQAARPVEAAGDPAPFAVKHRDSLRREGTGLYTVTSSGKDLKETEAFLRAQIERETPIYTMKLRDQIQGWYSLSLTSESLKTDQSHNGVADMTPEDGMVLFSALPDDDRECVRQ